MSVESGQGQYADDRVYPLPQDWEAVSADALDLATTQALHALEVEPAANRLRTYYDPTGDYAGTTYLDVVPNETYAVGAADLWAVSTLSIPVHARQGRLLFDGPDIVAEVARLLRDIPDELRLTELDQPVAVAAAGSRRPLLEVMWDLQGLFRNLLSTDQKTSNHWVFAAKLCARKRPLLFPVRDSLVCEYLSGGTSLGG